MIERPILLITMLALIVLLFVAIWYLTHLLRRRKRPTSGIIIKKELNRRVKIAVDIFIDENDDSRETKISDPVVNECFSFWIRRGEYENIIVTDKETWYKYNIGDMYVAKGSDAVGS